MAPVRKMFRHPSLKNLRNIVKPIFYNDDEREAAADSMTPRHDVAAEAS